MCLTAGAVSPVAYSASMNSYISLTDAPPRSTPRLLTETRSSFSARGPRARAPGVAPAPTPAMPAHPPRAYPGKPAPSYRGWSHSPRAPGRPQQSDVTFRSPTVPLPHETQVRTFGIYLPLDPVLSGEDPKGSAVRKPRGTPLPPSA